MMALEYGGNTGSKGAFLPFWLRNDEYHFQKCGKTGLQGDKK
jgi:hypothetical protein